MSIDLKAALALVGAEIETITAESGLFDQADVSGYFARRRKAGDASKLRLEAQGAVIRDQYDGAAIRFAGIRSTSTGGYVGALHNWRRAATQRLGGEAPA